MQDLIEQHLALFGHQDPETQACRRRILLSLAEFLAGLPLSQLTLQDLEKYHQHLIWQPGSQGLRSDNTISQMLLMSRRFLRWLVEQGRLPEECVKDWNFGPPSARPQRLLSRDQVQAILEAPSSQTPLGLRNRAIFSIICELGLMSRPCAALNLSDLDLAAYRLAGRRMGAGLAEKLERYLRLGRPALLARPEEPALFLTREGNRPDQLTICVALRVCANDSRVAPRLLHRSWQAHHQAQAERRGLR